VCRGWNDNVPHYLIKWDNGQGEGGGECYGQQHERVQGEGGDDGQLLSEQSSTDDNPLEKISLPRAISGPAALMQIKKKRGKIHDGLVQMRLEKLKKQNKFKHKVRYLGVREREKANLRSAANADEITCSCA
jgi:hypothetical protein